MKLVLSLLFVISCFVISAQESDTISVYFDINKSKIRADQVIKLTSVQNEIDLILTDSIHLIGMADSVGRLQANYRLSMRRAKEVEKSLFQKIQLDIPRTLLAKGEQELVDRSMNRRVDIVFFYPKVEVKTNTPIAKRKYDDCYELKLFILSYCNIKTFKKRKKSYVRIERELNSDSRIQRTTFKELHYGTINSKNDFEAKKVKWKTATTGKLWWKRKRYVTTLPARDFERFKFFTVSPKPCGVCHEDFAKNKRITTPIDTCYWKDAMVMSNIQFRNAIFNHKKMKIRVPKEYIYTQRKYLAGGIVNWKTKTLGKRKNYYFAKLGVENEYLIDIYRGFPCIETKDKTGKPCDGPIGHPCRIPCRNTSGESRFYLPIEVGVHFQNERKIPYAAVGLFYSRRNFEYDLLVGIHGTRTLYSSIQYKYNFINFEINSLRWKSNYTSVDWYNRFYIGPELKTNLNNSDFRYFEANLNIGYTLEYVHSKFAGRLFGQVGYGSDFIKYKEKSIYPVGQIGLTFFLW